MKMSSISFLAYLATISALIPATFCITYKFEGEACKLRDGGDGICGTWGDCGSAFNIPRNPPILCSPRGLDDIICCPPEKIKKPRKNYEDTETCSLLVDRDSKQTQQSLSGKACRMYSDTFNDNSEQPHILGGDKVEDMGNYPFMAALGYRRTNRNNVTTIDYNCGGMLISDRFVLTAAHCGDREIPTQVKMGAVNLTGDNRDSRKFLVDGFIAHPCYMMGMPYYDIALVKLEEAIKVSNYIFPACIFKEPEPDLKKKYIVTGWGATKPSGWVVSKTLLEVSLVIQHPDTCSSKWPVNNRTSFTKGFTENTMICATNPVKGGPCNGDSGGPLSLTNRNVHFTVIGVIGGGGTSCKDTDKPSLLTKIYPFLLWIEDVIWPDGNIVPLEWENEEFYNRVD